VLPSDSEVKCASAGVDALAALADAAHYARDQEREGYAWRLLRKRFPGTPRAALAAFALGRLEFDAHGSYPKAAEWFGTYLKEQPAGSLVREARGRLMEATLRAGDTRAARALGAAYLHDYPSGPHAELARSLEQSTP
jgi:TolA-binding protein